MSNIVYLSQDAHPKIGTWNTHGSGNRQIPGLLGNLDDCIVEIEALRETVRQAFDASRRLLDKLDDTIAALPDPKERSMLEATSRQARETLLMSSSTVTQALELMTAAAWTIRTRAYAGL
jgi:hypothetical protein